MPVRRWRNACLERWSRARSPVGTTSRAWRAPDELGRRPVRTPSVRRSRAPLAQPRSTSWIRFRELACRRLGEEGFGEKRDEPCRANERFGRGDPLERLRETPETSESLRPHIPEPDLRLEIPSPDEREAIIGEREGVIEAPEADEGGAQEDLGSDVTFARWPRSVQPSPQLAGVPLPPGSDPPEQFHDPAHRTQSPTEPRWIQFVERLACLGESCSPSSIWPWLTSWSAIAICCLSLEKSVPAHRRRTLSRRLSANSSPECGQALADLDVLDHDRSVVSPVSMADLDTRSEVAITSSMSPAATEPARERVRNCPQPSRLPAPPPHDHAVTVSRISSRVNSRVP